MPTPNKPAVMIRAEGRSHRTKAELELREKGEAALAIAVLLSLVGAGELFARCHWTFVLHEF